MSENALGLGSSRDREVSEKRKQLFAQNHFSNEDMLQNFPSFVRRINVTRFLAQYELFKMVQDLPGSIVELGVYKDPVCSHLLISWRFLALAIARGKSSGSTPLRVLPTFTKTTELNRNYISRRKVVGKLKAMI